MRDSLHDLHQAAGARFEGDELRDYGDPASEYAAVRGGVGVLDRTAQGVIEVTGRDRASFLHAILTNDVKSLTPGQGCAAALLDVHGKVQVFTWVWALDDRMLVLTPPGLAPATIEMFDAYLFSEKAYLRDATGELALLLLAGPETAAAVGRIADVGLPERTWSHVPGRIDGVEVRAVRGAGESGEVEAWLTVGARAAGTVWDAVVRAGGRPVGWTAWESLRIEAGTPVFGRDADPGVLLPEIPFLDRVSYTKGCYVGQEVVVRIRDRGHVNRHLCGLLLEGERVPPRGATLLAGDADVGRVTSAAWSYGLKRPIALGFVRRQHAEPGTALRVRLDEDAAVPATVVTLPMAR